MVKLDLQEAKHAAKTVVIKTLLTSMITDKQITVTEDRNQ